MKEVKGKKDANFIVRTKIVNNGKFKMTDIIHEIVVDAFSDCKTINNLDDLYENVACVVKDMISYSANERHDLDIVNFKVVANENNNTNKTELPLHMDIYYRHKDSEYPTILYYTIKELIPEPKEDRYALWKK